MARNFCLSCVAHLLDAPRDGRSGNYRKAPPFQPERSLAGRNVQVLVSRAPLTGGLAAELGIFEVVRTDVRGQATLGHK